METQTTTIIILTKNRAFLLDKNLYSLSKQTLKPTELIIVDNNSTDETPKIIKKYSGILPIKSIKTKVSGYSRLYNLGVKRVKGKLICFLDDDCFAKENWLKRMVETHKKYSKSIIQGQTFSLPKDNLYAQIMADHYQNWLKSNLVNEKELRVFDCKNVAVPREIFEKHGKFSTTFNIGSQDLELGLRFRKRGVKIILEPKAIAWHHERTDLKEFIRQHYRIAKSESLLNKKLKNNAGIGLPFKKKTLLNLKSALKREFNYLLTGDLLNAFKLPFAYLLLILVRSFGYCLTETENNLF